MYSEEIREELAKIFQNEQDRRVGYAYIAELGVCINFKEVEAHLAKRVEDSAGKSDGRGNPIRLHGFSTELKKIWDEGKNVPHTEFENKFVELFKEDIPQEMKEQVAFSIFMKTLKEEMAELAGVAGEEADAE
ncbi:hypothetical protein [Maridesulfovibrio zosterae]|uniref:hypothetical protein n=1 Tax=Maridesulfovibrio zosterae TaxID=82171 RepID=UPI000418E2D8|nr:hypothetical protein [Maridesulfovibrio zosterae]